MTTLLLGSGNLLSQSNLNCNPCHGAQFSLWKTGQHAQTQKDVADELAANWQGLGPDSVMYGSQAENCVACHAPTAVAALGGMTEAGVMGHFFTSVGGLYTAATSTADTANWPHVACVACHNVPGDHPVSLPASASFNSTAKAYDSVAISSQLCGACHGTLRFAGTDHRVFDAWRASRHGHIGQSHLAGELAGSWSGQSPEDVITGPQAENCIACHAPTSTNPKHNITEVQVLKRFFTTVGGRFDATTAVADTAHWEDVACAACHNPHNPGAFAYFNSTTGAYETMSTSERLCGQCHGTLRFPETDHRSYDIETGRGGIGIADQITMPGATCVSCHMHRSDVDGSNSRMFAGHTWSIFVSEPGGVPTNSCATCHIGMSSDSAQSRITGWKQEFADLDAQAGSLVAQAESTLAGSTDSLKLRAFDEARHNLDYAEMDESGGFHNHKYTIALLNDAIRKAASITGVAESALRITPAQIRLDQNYPNPFSTNTTIRFTLKEVNAVSLKLYDLYGRELQTLADGVYPAGSNEIRCTPARIPPGMYQLVCRSGGEQVARMVVLMK